MLKIKSIIKITFIIILITSPINGTKRKSLQLETLPKNYYELTEKSEKEFVNFFLNLQSQSESYKEEPDKKNERFRNEIFNFIITNKIWNYLPVWQWEEGFKEILLRDYSTLIWEKIKPQLYRTIETEPNRKVSRITFSGEFITVKTTSVKTIKSSLKNFHSFNIPIAIFYVWDIEENKLIEELNINFFDDTDSDTNSNETNKNISGIGTKTLRIFCSKTYQELLQINHLAEIKKAKFCDSGKKILSFTTDGRVYLLDSDNGELLKIFKLDDQKHIKSANITSDEKILIINVDNKNLEFYSIKTGDLLQTLNFENKISYFALNPENSLLAVCSGEKILVYKTGLKLVNEIKIRTLLNKLFI